MPEDAKSAYFFSDGKAVIAHSNSSGKLFAIDLGSSAVADLKVVEEARLVGLTKNHFIFVDSVKGSIITRECTDIAKRSTVPIEASGVLPILSQDCRFLIVYDAKRHNIHQIETATGKRIKTFPTGKMTIERMELSPKGRFVSLVGAEDDVVAIDVSTGQQQNLKSVGLGGNLFATVSLDEASMFVGNHGSVKVFNLKDGALLNEFDNRSRRRIELGQAGFLADDRFYSIDGSFSVFRKREVAGRIEVYERDGEPVVLQPKGRLAFAQLSPDRNSILIVSGDRRRLTVLSIKNLDSARKEREPK